MTNRAALHQIIPVYRLGLDESAFKVGVNGASGLHGRVAGVNCPGTDLFFVEGEKRPQAEHVIRGPNELAGAGFGHAEFLQKFPRLVR